MPDCPLAHRELRRKGVTLILLWQAYKASTPNGLQYSQCCEAYRQWAKKLDLVMRQRHRAGETLYVDDAGQTMPVVNPHTGEVHDASIFITECLPWFDVLMTEPIPGDDGHLTLSDRPGLGLVCDRAALEKYRVGSR